MTTKMGEKTIFDKFTKKYSLSKTLRFELKPMPQTRKFLQMDELEKEKIFPKDREKAEKYQILKYYLDLLHRDFINSALTKFKKERIDFAKVFEQLSKDKEDNSSNQTGDVNQANEEKGDLKSIRSKIAKFNGNGYLFDKKIINVLGEHFVEDNNGKVFFVKENEENVLIEEAPCIKFKNVDGEQDTVFNNFKGFTGYLSGFHENRKNLYKDDGKAGRVITRIIDQNLPRFFANIKKYKELINKYPEIKQSFGGQWEEYFGERAKEIGNKFNEFNQQNEGWAKIFQPGFYNDFFLQKDIDFYNYLIRKLNKDINQYSQKLKSEKKKEEIESQKDQEENKGSKKIPLFEKLHKQILGEVKKKSDFIEIVQGTLGDYLHDFITHSDAKLKLSEDILTDVFKAEDIEGIYISNKAINTLSNKWFLSWDFFGGKILEKQNEGRNESQKRKKISNFIALSEIKTVLDGMSEDEVSDIFKNEYVTNLEKSKHWKNFLNIWLQEWREVCKEYQKSKEELNTLIPKIPKEEAMNQDQKVVIKKFADASLSIYQMTKYFALLKGIKEVQVDNKNDEFYQKIDLYLFGDSLEDNEEKNKENNIYLYYNAFRNFLTKKPWSENKIKLNFDNGNLLGGWSKNEEKVKLGVIFRDNQKYYLGIINNKNKSILEDKSIYSTEGFEKMEMHSLKWKTLTGKGYKRDFGDKYSSHVFDFKINQYKKSLQDKGVAIQDLDDWIRLEDEKKNKDNQFPDDRKVLNKIIRFLKRDHKDNYIEDLQKLENEPYTQVIKNVQDLIKRQYKDEYPALKVFLGKDFISRKEFEEYKDKYGKEIYSLNFDKKIKRDTLEQLAKSDDGKDARLHLFQIYNKDFQLDKSLNNGKARKIIGKDNIETILFKMLFHDTNLKNKNGVVLTLNGGAKVFFRPRSLSKEKQKEVRNGKEIVAKNRYTENKISLHVPVTLNFGKPNGQYFKANELVNDLLQTPNLSRKAKIIGIDRGEKHLAYYTVIDQEENILEQGTLNRIYPKKKDYIPVELDKKRIVLKKNEHGQKRYDLETTGEKVNYVDYLQILDCKERNRLLQRKSWDSIEIIKDLKKGYISHVVNKLCELFLKYFEQDGVPPMIVFENLNMGFKQGRQKIEKQVYQNLELALAKKLGYLTRKIENPEKQWQHGGILNAFQFVPEIKNYSSDIEKNSQVGVLLYTDPSYTSTTCPNCGFRKRMTKTVFESVKSTKKKFEDHKLQVHFVDGKYKFTFITNQKENGEDYGMTDTVFSDVSRIYRKPKENKKGWIVDVYQNMTEQFDNLLKEKHIKNKNEEIFSKIKRVDDVDFWKQFMYFFNLILQIRNSSSKRYALKENGDELVSEGEDTDFIHCPHCHFHSERKETWEKFTNKFSNKLIEDLRNRDEDVFSGDVNGAYNIARKGKMMIERIKRHPKDLENFCNKHGKRKEDLKFEKGKYEITKGKRGSKKVIDSITQYPDLFISNWDWDEATARWTEKRGIK